MVASVVSLGPINIALLDVIVLAILLIALLIGLIFGFARLVLSLAGVVLSLILAAAFCGEFSATLGKWGWLVTKVKEFCSSLFGLTGTGAYGSEEALRLALEGSKIPSFLHSAIILMSAQNGYELNVISIVAGWAITAISFITIFVGTLILSAMLKLVFKAITNVPPLKKIDRALGMIFTTLSALCLIIACLTILSIISPINNLLEPEGTVCVTNLLLKGIAELPFMKNLLTKLIIKP